MKKIFSCLFIAAIGFNCYAKKDILDRNDLKALLDERKENFESYLESLEKKSGIFGNKTRRDILRSNEILTEIVKTDNRIIRTLNLAIDFQNFRTNNLAFDISKRENRLDNLLAATDTLSKQVQQLTSQNKSLKRSGVKLKWLLWLLIISNIVLLWLRYRKK